jgi:hypothetical protein
MIPGRYIAYAGVSAQDANLVRRDRVREFHISSCIFFWEVDLDQKPVLGCGTVLAMATDSRP